METDYNYIYFCWNTENGYLFFVGTPLNKPKLDQFSIESPIVWGLCDFTQSASLNVAFLGGSPSHHATSIPIRSTDLDDDWEYPPWLRKPKNLVASPGCFHGKTRSWWGWCVFCWTSPKSYKSGGRLQVSSSDSSICSYWVQMGVAPNPLSANMGSCSCPNQNYLVQVWDAGHELKGLTKPQTGFQVVLWPWDCLFASSSLRNFVL